MRCERVTTLALVMLVLGCGGTQTSHLDDATLPDAGSEVADGRDEEHSQDSPDSATEIGTSILPRPTGNERQADWKNGMPA